MAQAKGVVAEAASPPTLAAMAWPTLGVLLLLTMVAYLDRNIVSLMVGMIKHDLGVSDVQVSLLQGLAFAVFYSTCALPLGYAVDRFPRRWIVFGGVMIWALAAMACGLAQGFGQMLIARMLVGLGEAALAPAAYSMLGDLFPRNRLAFALSLYMVGNNLGSALALAGGGAILDATGHGLVLPVIGHLAPWREAFILTGLPGIFVAFLILLLPEPKRSGVEDGQSVTWAQLFRFIGERKGFFIFHAIGFSLILMLAHANSSWSPSVVMRQFGWTPAEVGQRFALVFGIGGVLGVLTNGAVVDYFYSRGVADAHMRYYAFVVLAIGAAGIAANFLAHSGWTFVFIIAIASFFNNFLGVAVAALQTATPAHFRGRVAALFLMVANLTGASLGPFLVAFFTDRVYHDEKHVSLSIATTFAVVAPLACLFLVLGLKPMRRAQAMLP